ncbi:MAG: hypothetical protein H6555_08970 [Lewinellaceae bacterium]|nr:hypothetical protein [Lewinellaceae bacterium]
MSHPLATYSFLPWLRQGLANNITQGDGDAGVKLRASVAVQLLLKAEGVAGAVPDTQVNKPVQLYGPGDIVGIEAQAIVRHEPRDWITNFEPNYLPYIEFYDEDFVWRYTPAKPDGHRLRPWIALVVLEEGEFKDGQNLQGRPLPFIEVGNAAELFPPADQLWAWAHVHVNRSLGTTPEEVVSNQGDAVAQRLQSTLAENADLAYSRLLCPRRLDPKKTYHAFVIPVFEPGRLAGLGLDVNATPKATTSAWETYPGREGGSLFPYYHRWTFQTGEVGDFEYLVRLLKPQPIDARVGTRDMDVQDPGSNLQGIDNPALGGILKLGGALRIPRDTMKPDELALFDKYDQWAQPFPQPFQLDLAAYINLADDYAAQGAAAAHAQPKVPDALVDFDDDNPDQDPLITPPLYGRWHALTERLLTERDGTPLNPVTVPDGQGGTAPNWIHELNLDPRFRTAAGFGTKVVQDKQEPFMDAAWDQIGEVLEANRKMRLAQWAKAISQVWHAKYLEPLAKAAPTQLLTLTAPLQKRIITDGFTIHRHVQQSPAPAVVFSGTLRRVMRPGGRLIQRLPWADNPAASPATLINNLNEGTITIAPPKTVPTGTVTTSTAVETLQPTQVPGWLASWLRRYPWLKFIPLLLAIILLLVLLLLAPLGAAGWSGGLSVVAALLAAFWFLYRKEREVKAIAALDAENQTPESIDALPTSSDFRITVPGETFRPSGGSTDSEEAARFKMALRETNAVLVAATAAARRPPLVPLKIDVLTAKTFADVHPAKTIPGRYFQQVFLPDHIRAQQVETFTEAWAYPRIDVPMYKPLVDISADLFLPNINFVANNSISLLETNQKFIESYLVGLNHEFARELLWREYPTDQRGSYFRQFWDVSSYLDTQNRNADALREQLYDIPKLHRWSVFSQLGDHDNRETGGDKEEEVVLVIRGELLKRYPNAVIYAQKAAWPLKPDGTINKTLPREPVKLTPAQEENPPRDILKTPLYEAKVDPDIYFFGFDLNAKEVQGAKGDEPDAKTRPGWFFIIKERPGEPRFGLDIERPAAEPLNTWNDLAWTDVMVEKGTLQIKTGMPAKSLTAPGGAQINEKQQYDEDVQVPWNTNTHAADVAYILYQVPVLVAVHGAEMLPSN